MYLVFLPVLFLATSSNTIWAKNIFTDDVVEKSAIEDIEELLEEKFGSLDGFQEELESLKMLEEYNVGNIDKEIKEYYGGEGESFVEYLVEDLAEAEKKGVGKEIEHKKDKFNGEKTWQFEGEKVVGNILKFIVINKIKDELLEHKKKDLEDEKEKIKFLDIALNIQHGEKNKKIKAVGEKNIDKSEILKKLMISKLLFDLIHEGKGKKNGIKDKKENVKDHKVDNNKDIDKAKVLKKVSISKLLFDKIHGNKDEKDKLEKIKDKKDDQGKDIDKAEILKKLLISKLLFDKTKGDKDKKDGIKDKLEKFEDKKDDHGKDIDKAEILKKLLISKFLFDKTHGDKDTKDGIKDKLEKIEDKKVGHVKDIDKAEIIKKWSISKLILDKLNGDKDEKGGIKDKLLEKKGDKKDIFFKDVVKDKLIEDGKDGIKKDVFIKKIKKGDKEKLGNNKGVLEEIIEGKDFIVKILKDQLLNLKEDTKKSVIKEVKDGAGNIIKDSVKTVKEVAKGTIGKELKEVIDPVPKFLPGAVEKVSSFGSQSNGDCEYCDYYVDWIDSFDGLKSRGGFDSFGDYDTDDLIESIPNEWIYGDEKDGYNEKGYDDYNSYYD